MVPADILSRDDLTATAKLVLGVLDMESFGDLEIAISHSAIGKSCGSGRTAVIVGLRQLAAKSLIEMASGPGEQVQVYRLKYRRGGKRQTKPGDCVVCCRSRKVNTIGMCGGCVAQARADAKVAAILRERPGATRQEVYLEIRAAGAKTIGRAFDTAIRKLAIPREEIA